jgi:hypothetical protein
MIKVKSCNDGRGNRLARLDLRREKKAQEIKEKIRACFQVVSVAPAGLS